MLSYKNNNINYDTYTYGIIWLIVTLSVALKLSVITVGAPYVTIDDQSSFEAGFLVWFGQAPPQRMYLESWLVGISNILTYIGIALESGKGISSNIVAEAYQSFNQNPDPFIASYRLFALFIDIMTALLIFKTARLMTAATKSIDSIAILAVAFYVLSYNTVWCLIVARPDNLTVFFSTLGLFYYIKAIKSENSNHYWLSAIAFGLATGLKLHAGFFVFLVVIDRLRVLDFRTALAIVIPYGVISIAVFSVSAGSPLFDPLLYIKLRVLNAIDDVSPWLYWGDQVWTALRGTGWLIVPVLLAATIQVIREKNWRSPSSIASLAVFSIGWLALFLSIRQLRAYWMLPALPVFYLFALSYLDTLKYRSLNLIIPAVIIMVLATQTVMQAVQFKEVEFNGLRNWIIHNVKHHEVIYIFGFQAVNLPKSQVAVNSIKHTIDSKLLDTKIEGQSFTERHVRNWEERSRLMLIDMLENSLHDGYTYYSLGHESTLSDYMAVISSKEVNYIFLQKSNNNQSSHPLESKLSNKFVKIETVIGPGGGGSGLMYDIYKKQ